MDLPRLIITGSSGVVGRHLVEAFLDRTRVFGIARRSALQCGLAAHPNLVWLQADVRDARQVGRAFEQVAALGGAEVLVHLAAYFDLTGEERDEYWQTNVHGMRRVLYIDSEMRVDASATRQRLGWEPRAQCRSSTVCRCCWRTCGRIRRGGTRATAKP